MFRINFKFSDSVDSRAADPCSTQGRSALGAQAESIACLELQRLGYRILARNWKVSLGEIDIVCSEGRELVFVEVKSRREYSCRSGSKLFDNITESKKRKLRRLAELYALKNRARCRYSSMRIDVVGVLFDRVTLEVIQIRHIKGAV